jgi:hypothetical protein
MSSNKEPNFKNRKSNIVKQKKVDFTPYVKNGKLYFYGPLKLSELSKVLNVSETLIIKNLFLKG